MSAALIEGRGPLPADVRADRPCRYPLRLRRVLIFHRTRNLMDDIPTAAPTDLLLGEARDYDQLLDALRKRLHQLGTAMERVDDLAGLPSRYVNKIFAPMELGKLSPTLTW
jgi:hypothetical protein